jgi:hypothetical protein
MSKAGKTHNKGWLSTAGSLLKVAFSAEITEIEYIERVYGLVIIFKKNYVFNFGIWSSIRNTSFSSQLTNGPNKLKR